MTDENKEFEDRTDYLLHCKLGKELTMDALIQGRNDKWFEYVEIRNEIMSRPDEVTVQDVENLNDKLIQVHQLDVTVLYSNYNILDQRWKTREAQEREAAKKPKIGLGDILFAVIITPYAIGSISGFIIGAIK